MALTLQELQQRASEIDVVKVATELLAYIDENVENFIDNQQRAFQVCISVISDDEEKTAAVAEARKLALLFDEVEDPEIEMPADVGALMDAYDKLSPEQKRLVDEAAKQMEVLHARVADVKETMRKDTAALAKIFKKMIYFYELVGLRQQMEGERLRVDKVEKEHEGYVALVDCSYDSTWTPMKFTEKKPVLNEEGEQIGTEDGVVEEVLLPPGFVVDLLITFWDKRPLASLF